MSSSTGDPSRKIPWYPKMMAKLNREAKAREVERRQTAPRKENSTDRRKRQQEDTLAGK